MITNIQKEYANEQLELFDEIHRLDYITAIESDESYFALAYQTIDNFSRVLKDGYNITVKAAHTENEKLADNMNGMNHLDNKPSYSVESYTFSNKEFKSLLESAQESVVSGIAIPKSNISLDETLLYSATESTNVIMNSLSVAMESGSIESKRLIKKNIKKELADIRITMESNINAIISIGDTIKSKIQYEESHPTYESINNVCSIMKDYISQSLYMYDMATNLMNHYEDNINQDLMRIKNNPIT